MELTDARPRRHSRRSNLARASAISAFLIALVIHARPQTIPENHKAVDAVQGVVEAFNKHPIVVIGEWRHGLQEMGEFYIRLVQDPSFQSAVHNIVIEFASRNNQELLDRYIAGEDIPLPQLRRIWRDTTKVAAWEFPMYADWLAAIRDVNRKLPPERRFRVLAGDTAIDWQSIHSHAQWLALGDNNNSFADVIVNQVLAKRSRAFVVLGGNHVAKLGDRNGGPNMSTLVEAKYPGALYVVIHHLMPHDPDESLLRLPDANAAALYDLAGTPLGEKPDANGVAPLRYVDAWLYVGPSESMKQSTPAPGSIEAAYAKELDRRSMIEWGELRARKFLGAAIAK